MTKDTITRIFLGSLIAVVGGVILLLIASGLGFTGTVFIMSGPDVVAVQPTSMTWLALATGIIGIVAVIGGALSQFVAWIGALVNTAQLQDKTWFLVLLLLGIFGLGFIPMLVYVLGVDSTAAAPAVAQRSTSPAPPTDLPKAA